MPSSALRLLLLTLLCATLAGCGTLAGFGKDVQAVGGKSGETSRPR